MMGDLRSHLLEAPGVTREAMERAAKEMGVPSGQKANDRQLAGILARLHGWRIEQPSMPDGVPTASAGGGELGPATADTPQSEGTPVEGSDAATGSEAASPQPSAPAPSFDDILAVTGGVEVPTVDPELQQRIDRARAKGRKGKPDDEEQVEQIRAALESGS